MPTYEYRCKDCGHEFEVNQAFTDDALTECPTCHGALKKKFGSVGISFKGSGFYKTDTRSSPAAATPAKSSTDSGATSEGTSGTSGDGSGSSSGSGEKATSPTSDTASSGSSSTGGTSGTTKAATPA